jgi:hypothetical protein
MSPSPHIVYGYADPRDGALRYVGKSSQGLVRPKQFGSHGHRCGNWIKALAAEGLRPKIIVLQELDTHCTARELNEAEVYEIQRQQDLGCNLTNLTDGGDGPMRGRKHTFAARAAISAANRESMKGNKNFAERRHKPESIEKIRTSKLGKARPDSVRWAVAAAQLGRKHSVEHNAKIGAAHKGRTQSAEWVAKRVASRLANTLERLGKGDKAYG